MDATVSVSASEYHGCRYGVGGANLERTCTCTCVTQRRVDMWVLLAPTCSLKRASSLIQLGKSSHCICANPDVGVCAGVDVASISDGCGIEVYASETESNRNNVYGVLC